MEFKRALCSLAIGALLLASPAHATVSIVTPALQATIGTTYVCEIFNGNSSNIAPDVSINDSTGTAVTSSVPAIVGNRQGNLSYLESTAVSTLYCKVDVTTATIADNLRVNLELRDSNGDTFVSVPGLRVGSSNTPLYSYAISGPSGYYACFVTNAGTSSITLDVDIVSASGGTLQGNSSVTVASGNSYSTGIVSSTQSAHCYLHGMTGTQASKLRVVFVSEDTTTNESVVAVTAI